jgi:hypothetical protein
MARMKRAMTPMAVVALLEFDLHDLIRPRAAGRRDFHRVALGLADQGARDGVNARRAQRASLSSGQGVNAASISEWPGSSLRKSQIN